MDPDKRFDVPDEVLEHARQVVDARAVRRTRSGRRVTRAGARPTRSGPAEFDRISRRELPAGWTSALPAFETGASVATRSASGEVLSALAPVLPELWGGSADLAESNNTTMKGEPSFIPEEYQTKDFPGHRYGRTLHFGIREHGMGAILNGIALHGGTRPYGGTFLVFSDYMRPVGTTRRADEAAGHLRVDARLHRPRRGRPDPPADRAPVGAARHPRPRRGAPGRRQRDRRRLEGGAGAHRPPRRRSP